MCKNIWKIDDIRMLYYVWMYIFYIWNNYVYLFMLVLYIVFSKFKKKNVWCILGNLLINNIFR